MYLRFEKFSHRDGQHRYLVLSLTQTLFGDWCVSQASGPLGHAGGQERRNYCASLDEAQSLFNTARAKQVKRGYVPIPVQMGLF
ncbi:WGR domain-containing protein [Arenibacterium sp. LLYu02]|uniref:WGR domain-containing protein n=1 Tax=Arenibacterium sp. LLYu02 TaxID=3404132 RepID=UPI003B214099